MKRSLTVSMCKLYLLKILERTTAIKTKRVFNHKYHINFSVSPLNDSLAIILQKIWRIFISHVIYFFCKGHWKIKKLLGKVIRQGSFSGFSPCTSEQEIPMLCVLCVLNIKIFVDTVTGEKVQSKGNSVLFEDSLHLVTLESILSCTRCCSWCCICGCGLDSFVGHHPCCKLLLGLLKTSTCGSI